MKDELAILERFLLGLDVIINGLPSLTPAAKLEAIRFAMDETFGDYIKKLRSNEER